MGWESIVSLGALGVAALSVWLGYRERAAGLRAALYGKQVDVYGLVLAALAELHAVAIEFTTAKSYPLDSKSREELRLTAKEQIAGVAHAFTENVVFLPASVAEAVFNYRTTFVAITAPAAAEKMYPPELYNAADPQIELTNAFERVWEVMRHQLGTEALSKQTLKAVGAPPLPPEEDG
jgi:hypothetical protein